MAEAQKYYALLTATGQAAMVKAVALGQTVSLTHMAVGDANGADFTPVESMTALVNEVHRAPVNALEEDPETPNMLVADLVIPHETGGFTVRELGIFDAAGNLFAIASIPPTYKPQMQEGGTTEIRFRMLVVVSNASVVELIVDPTRVLATRDFVEKEVKDHNADAAAHPPLQTHITDKNDPHNTLPEGGETGQVLIKQENGSIAWGTVAGVPVGELCFSTTGEALPGTIAANVKQKILCSLAPQLFEWMKNSGSYLTDEAAWDAEAAAQDGSCGRYCWDGGEYFILPCYTRYFAAAHGEKAVGDWDGDAIREISGQLSDLLCSDSVSASGAFEISSQVHTSAEYSGDGERCVFEFKASNKVPTAEENRTKTVYVLPCIKAFDVPINAAHVDMLALAQQVAAINGNKVDRSEWVELVPGEAWQLPNDLIIQCGQDLTRAAYKTLDFPIAFPNACIGFQVGGNQAGSYQIHYFSDLAKESVVIGYKNAAGSSGAPSSISDRRWTAIGF
ncbi:phage tail protein [Halodesulfovibrio aestuarii]|uniref:Phage tail protein n=1 Tax=Halodesulfovibrio aestuarii TaxID=126333 RepID=A0ABV4JTX1_9BACT